MEGCENLLRRWKGEEGRILGRWLTPDLLGGDITNPQSLNRYAYALNNPTTLTDPLGLDATDCAPNGSGGVTCSGPDSVTVNGGTPPNTPTLGECPFFNCVPNCSIFTCGPAPWNNGGGGGTIFVTSYGTSGGGSASAPKPEPPTNGNKNVFACAADFGDRYSIAGGLHALGIGTSGAGGFITNALGGNAFSGATNLITSFASGAAGGHNVFYNMAQSLTAGPLQGVPGGRGPWGASISDLATGAIARGAFSAVTGAGQTLQTLNGAASLASTGIDAAEFAAGVGLVKFGYDALSYGVGLLGCKAGVIQ